MIDQYRIKSTVGSWSLTMVVLLAGLYVNSLLVSWRWAVVDMLKIAAIISPFLFVALITASPVWLALTVGLLPAVSFSLPLPLLHRISPPTALAFALALCVAGRVAISKRHPPVMQSLPARLMFVVGALIALRILYDRPGSSSFGETGGAGEAFSFGLGFLSFWTLSVIAAMKWDARLNFRVLFWLAVLACLFHILRLEKSSLISFLFGLFHRAEWLLSAAVFAWLCARYQQRKDPARRTWVIFAVIAILLISMFSAHRSRPFIAIGVLASIAYVYRFLRRSVLIIVCACSVLIGVLFLKEQGLPPGVMRALSTVVPVSQHDYALAMRRLELPSIYGGSAELGWSSEFRKTMSLLAWKKIRKHPILGNGFAYSGAELFAMAEAARSGEAQRVQAALATSGGYHNTVLAMAVFCGIPVALVFVVALLAIPWQLALCLRSTRSPEMRMFSSAVLAFFVASSGQMLVNGAGVDLFVVCCLLGAMNGITYRILNQKNVGASLSPDGLPETGK